MLKELYGIQNMAYSIGDTLKSQWRAKSDTIVTFRNNDIANCIKALKDIRHLVKQILDSQPK